jgi:hypothetical protein
MPTKTGKPNQNVMFRAACEMQHIYTDGSYSTLPRLTGHRYGESQQKVKRKSTVYLEDFRSNWRALDNLNIFWGDHISD